MVRFFLFLLAISTCPLGMQAQLVKGKTVGIYVSLRNFNFTQPYNIPVSVFLQRQDTLGLASENLRLGATIKLGTYLTQLTRRMGADSVYFINAQPELSQQFVRNTGAGGLNLSAVAGILPKGTDYILSVDSLYLGTVTRTSLYVISNEMYSERRNARVARMALRVHSVAPRNSRSLSIKFDEDLAQHAADYLPLPPSSSPVENILTRIWNTAMYQASQAVQ